MTAHHLPAGRQPAGIDTSWQLPRRMRPPARDLPALAWLASRRLGQHPDKRPVGRYPAAAALPLWLVLLLVQHATGTLAVHGRNACLIVVPTWPTARRPYRSGKAAALGAIIVAVILLAVLGAALLYGLVAVGFAAGVPAPVLVLAATWAGPVAFVAWLAGLAAHPLLRELVRQLGCWGRTERHAVPAHDRTALVHSLCGRGSPSVAAGRLMHDLLKHADARGWALLTNGGTQARNARKYARVGFGWLPDGSRRMLRTAAGRPTLVDAAVRQAAAFTERLGVHLDEVRVVDGVTADSGRAGGRSYVRLPVSYLLRDALPPHARATWAHEIGHHALGHFTAAERRRRVGPKLAALAVAAPVLVTVVLTAPPAVAGTAPAVTVAALLAVCWLCDRPVRRGEHDADTIAVALAGVDDVAAQLRRLHAQEQAHGLLSRVFRRLFDPAHPPLARRLERVLQQQPVRQQRSAPSAR